MQFTRMPIEIESPEEIGYSTILYNLAESSVRDLSLDELTIQLTDLVLSYGHHRGYPELRSIIASESQSFTADDVLVCSGAATALFIVATTLLNPGDHLVVIRPNYGTNLETPRAIGCEMSVIDLSFDNDFELNLNEIRQAIQPNTRLISVTTPHNPTGTEIPVNVMHELVTLAEAHHCYLLVDETYRYLNFQSPLRPYVAGLSEHVISVSSLSKAFGVPGIRIGWIICRDNQLMYQFLAAKEQIMITNSVIDEQIALCILQEHEHRLAETHRQIGRKFAITREFFSQTPYLEWIEPTAGVVCFPRLRSEFQLDQNAFYSMLYNRYQTVVGPGHWFEQDRIYMRIGFGYPTEAELITGLRNIENSIRQTLLS